MRWQRKVGGKHKGAPAECAAIVGDGFRSLLGAATMDDDVGACASEFEGDRATDTAGGPRHQGGLPRKVGKGRRRLGGGSIDGHSAGSFAIEGWSVGCPKQP